MSIVSIGKIVGLDLMRTYVEVSFNQGICAGISGSSRVSDSSTDVTENSRVEATIEGSNTIVGERTDPWN